MTVQWNKETKYRVTGQLSSAYVFNRTCCTWNSFTYNDDLSVELLISDDVEVLANFSAWYRSPDTNYEYNNTEHYDE